MTTKELQTLQPFDLVRYIPTGEQALVKSVREDGKGAFCLFRIQSTASFCFTRDIEKI